MSAPVVEARRVIHPGPARWGRVLTACGGAARQTLARLHEGETLEDGLIRLFQNAGVESGAFRLLGGALDQAFYHVALPEDASPRAVDYGAAIEISGGAWIVTGSGSYGPSVKGGPLIHLHGALADIEGQAHGGHLNNGRCVVGPGGVRVLILSGAGFGQAADPETGFSTFFPLSETTDGDHQPH